MSLPGRTSLDLKEINCELVAYDHEQFNIQSSMRDIANSGNGFEFSFLDEVPDFEVLWLLSIRN